MTAYDKDADCERCGHKPDSGCKCGKDPYHEDTAAQIRTVVLLTLLLAVIVGVTIATCLSWHGAGPSVKTYHAASA